MSTDIIQFSNAVEPWILGFLLYTKPPIIIFW